jgi:ADP-dependent NAD(P)H-hydrate dehydratase / NAD(P)H-hydrate epimerase
MLKIIDGSEVSTLDSLVISSQKITSFDLMERAADSFVGWFLKQEYPVTSKTAIFFGAGNNGGDGLAIARLLHKHGYRIHLFRCFNSDAKLSDNCVKNFNLLPSGIPVSSWEDLDLDSVDLIIDSYLGVGLKGDLRPEAKSIISKINSFEGIKISVDIPSGLPSDSICSWESVKSDFTITFGFPKLSLLLPDHAHLVGEVFVADIGISDSDYRSFYSNYYFLREQDILPFHKKFHRFSHKGDFGKVLLIAGSKGKMGAAVLSSKAALRTGSGLVTCMIPEDERLIIQIAVPEAMVVFDELGIDFSGFDAIGLGPGLGLDRVAILERLFDSFFSPVVLDADALSILASNPNLVKKIPAGSVLTPHIGEFERLFGRCNSHLIRLKLAKEFCQNHQVNMVLKGANSVLTLVDGRQIFNSSGSNYMATAGMGDVLTGMITSFLGQGYTPEESMICAVFQHGLAGELAGAEKLRSTIASDLIEKIPVSFKKLGVE